MTELFKNYIRKKITPLEIGIVEFGINDIRLDALFVNCHKRYIRGFEFKATREDFVRDRKWWKYLKYCNTFTFVTLPGLIKPEDLDSKTGLIYLSNSQYGYIIDTWIKRPKKKDVDPEVYVKVISLMLDKAKFRKEDIF